MKKESYAERKNWHGGGHDACVYWRGEAESDNITALVCYDSQNSSHDEQHLVSSCHMLMVAGQE